MLNLKLEHMNQLATRTENNYDYIREMIVEL
jgi:hypothetical protein